MFEKLKNRWELKSGWQVFIVLIVFACTGFTVMFLKEPILSLIAAKEERNWIFTTIYYILILPVYFIILLFYGFIFGQSKFFLGFVKKTFSRFKRKNK
ncbi:hypothetical protein MATR_04810 [Marivirga tractuosa]|uniref:DUF6787 domain-containing protein n=1 Tax=Marivirga tractuosa (strain ATCC 23168 / DSM 4126 / NBRC 15989 / NCIMB 1408 / VKM B-1430 / H-43) TaxID=643867 RepID=E4TSS6_MARTH|nr:DUF6787 family protein [Marivirga tractuosa]ADR21886.1 conserved hypothetical protein, membrane [Marivirga tractuosa DSM 4126]BDD13656.1 hypothetical protein MATR_04810 [Marivirga tractuosa]